MNESIISDSRPRPSGQAPLISWIVPVFNTRGVLVETLDSIAAMAGTCIEIIVVDDGSTDGSGEVISSWAKSCDVPTLHLRQDNAGLSAARMAGVRHAQGEFIGFCDSDDRIESPCYIKMAEIALRENCDVAICRSVEFDGVSQIVYDFYDASLWDEVLDGRPMLVTSALREPRVFRFEPNANTRLWRRSFADRNALSFPLGLHFEDFPAHVEALACAQRVLLLNSTGYHYRVNRPGKITDQKSEKRFDMLKSIQIAFDSARRLQVSTAGRAYIAIMAARMTYWCGIHTLNRDRQRFFRQACEHLAASIDPAAASYAMGHGIDRREAILVSAFRAKAVRFLVALSSGRRSARFWALGLLFNRKHGRKFRRTLARAGLRKFKSGLRGLVAKG